MTVLPEEFPDPLRVRAEIAFGAPRDAAPQLWTWTGVNEDGEEQVKTLDGVIIRFGREDQQQVTSPSQLNLSLDDDRAVFTPDHPLSPHYGRINVGTPIRITPLLSDDPDEQLTAITMLQDSFARTLPDGDQWGRPDFGPPWVPTSINPTFHTATVDGTSGIITLLTPPAGPIAALTSFVTFLDGEITFGVSVGQTPASDHTAARVGYRDYSPFGGYTLGLEFDDVGNVSLDLGYLSGTSDSDDVARADDVLTYAPNDIIRVKVRVEGTRHQIRVWADGDPEPGTWDIDVVHNPQRAEDETVAKGLRPGAVSLQAVSQDSTDNSTISFVDLLVEVPPPTWYGFISEWNVTWPEGDLAQPGVDVDDPADMRYMGYAVTQITADGALRQILASNIVESSLKRQVKRIANVSAYWPMEETGQDIVEFASGLPGGTPATVIGDNLTAGTLDLWAGSEGLPEFGDGTGVIGVVNEIKPAESWRVDGLFWMETVTTLLSQTFIQVWTNATESNDAWRWQLRITDDDELNLIVLNAAGAIIINDSVAFDPLEFYGRPLRFVLRVFPSLISGIQYTVTIFQPRGALPLTVATIGPFTEVGPTSTNFPVRVDGGAGNDDSHIGLGHLTVTRNANTDPFAGGADVGFLDEKAGNRFIRIADELRVPWAVAGDPEMTERMGPEVLGSVGTILRDIETTDGGIISESWNIAGLVYRPRSSLVNQTPKVEFDAKPAGLLRPEIRPQLLPSKDDRDAANDVTVQDSTGNFVRLTDPDDIRLRGLYELAETINSAGPHQLNDIASFLLLLGTWPEMRHRQITPAIDDAFHKAAAWLGVQEGDLIRVINLPVQHPPGPLEVLLYGSNRGLFPKNWNERVSTSLAGPYKPGVIAGNGEDSEDLGYRFDTARAYLAADIDDSTTSIDVITPVLRPINSTSSFESPFTTGTDDFDTWQTADLDSFTRSVEQAFRGGWSGRAVPTGLANTASIISDSDVGAGTAYQTFDAEAWVYTESSNVQARADILFTGDPYPTLLATITGTLTPITPGVWTRLFVSGSTTAIVNSARIRVFIDAVANPLAASDIVFIDDAEVGLPGTPWVNTTDHAAEFPFPIVIGGEEMTVTAATTPTAERVQTFTVTRAVNGISKSHVAGVPVRLRTPLRYEANWRDLA